MPSVRPAESEHIDEELDSLDHNLKRLRIEYEQFFLGAMKREPYVLRGKVQKLVTKMVNEPPRNARQKFRFNTLNAKFQVYRQLWGRTMRQMEAGTYKRDRFKVKIHSQPGAAETPPARPDKKSPTKSGSSIDQLHGALLSARKKTGQSTDLSSDVLNKMVKKQMDTIREKHGDVKVKFKVVIENNKAKVKASVKK